MPNPNVDVSYASGTFTFDPDSVQMTAAGVITLKKDPANASWTFTGGSVKNGGSQFHVTVPPGGQTVTIRDDHTSNGTWQYEVTIDDGGTSHTSPDPEIINLNPPVKK